MRRLFLIAILAVIVPCQLTSQATDSGGETVLRPGDAVQITVWRKPELSGEFTIAANGTVDHPLYQAVQVANIPMSTARQRLQVFLRDWETNPQFLLKPMFRVSVGGEVRNPSLYTFAPEMTIAQAVAAAGGVTERGRLDRVRVLRTGGDIVVDLTASGGTGNTPIRSGDQIIVGKGRAGIFRDYVVPAVSIVMSTVTLVNILTR
jgi:polysaccharide export outer membrane protein